MKCAAARRIKRARCRPGQTCFPQVRRLEQDLGLTILTLLGARLGLSDCALPLVSGLWCRPVTGQFETLKRVLGQVSVRLG
mmetsp:Transcript_15909/g.42823  ORF Transcript_15909/g.42823 Transcript_15909/m.42823 type:complete len:81 (-) Transcript_15909:362-604(-)